MPEQIQSALATLPLGVIVKWLLLFFPLVSLGIWHYFQDKGFEYLARNPSPRTFEALHRLARMRSYQVIGVWLIAFAFIAIADVSHRMEMQTVDQPAPAVNQTQPAPVTAQPTVAAQPAATQTPPVAPSDQPADNPEEKLDTLKQRYEDLLISFFLLDRCGQTAPQDIELINNYMTKELAAAGAAPSLREGIFSAAQGSYESVYSDTPCQPKFIDPTLKQYNEMMTKLKNP